MVYFFMGSQSQAFSPLAYVHRLGHSVVGQPWQQQGLRAPSSSPLQGQNPFELAFSLEQAHPGETDFSLECPARPGEGPGRVGTVAEGYVVPESRRGKWASCPGLLVQICPRASPSTSQMPRKGARRKSGAGQLTASQAGLKVSRWAEPGTVGR